MELRLLGESDFDAIHETFIDAFSDYAVPVDFDVGRLQRMMARRGTDLSASVGAFEDGRMAAVMATGVREFEGIPSAYDTFTGVRPAFRGQRLAGKLFDVAREELEGRGIRRFVLEVIQTNENAVKAYTRAGFITRRNFECFEIEAGALAAVEVPEGVEIRRNGEADTARWAGWRDWSPSWQNSDASVGATVEEVAVFEAVAFGEVVGGAVVVPQARDLPQLAVAADRRRRGIGSALLAAACREIEAGEPLRIINVPDPADAAFYRSLGAKSLLAQFEMILEFQD